MFSNNRPHNRTVFVLLMAVRFFLGLRNNLYSTYISAVAIFAALCCKRLRPRAGLAQGGASGFFAGTRLACKAVAQGVSPRALSVRKCSCCSSHATRALKRSTALGLL